MKNIKYWKSRTVWVTHLFPWKICKSIWQDAPYFMMGSSCMDRTDNTLVPAKQMSGTLQKICKWNLNNAYIFHCCVQFNIHYFLYKQCISFLFWMHISLSFVIWDASFKRKLSISIKETSVTDADNLTNVLSVK